MRGKLEKSEMEEKKRMVKRKDKGRKNKTERFKIDFWNITWLINNDVDFWKDLREWNVLVMSET